MERQHAGRVGIFVGVIVRRAFLDGMDFGFAERTHVDEMLPPGCLILKEDMPAGKDRPLYRGLGLILYLNTVVPFRLGVRLTAALRLG